KMLAPERRGDAPIAAMLADEARVVGALHHPGIVAALDYLETEEHGPVFVLEFVDGASLRTVLKLGRRQYAVVPEVLPAHRGADGAEVRRRAALSLRLERGAGERAGDRFADASEMAAALLHACPPLDAPGGAVAELVATHASSVLLPARSAAAVVPGSDAERAG